MKFTQFCIFEITDKCNRGHEHWQCPNMRPERWQSDSRRLPMNDDQIVNVAKAMYAGGFTGCCAFHHYCEPMMAWPRLRGVIARIRSEVPQSRFLLWTNGDMLPGLVSELSVFEKCMVTNYACRDLRPLRSVIKEVHVIPTNLDWRCNPPRTAITREPNCIRPYLEIIFDYFGNVRTCCMDWKNETGIGNIHDTPFDVLWQQWLVQRINLASLPMAEDSPHRCLTCGTRYTNLAHYVPEIATRTLEHLKP